MIERTELGLTREDHDKAFTEVSFLLEIFVRTTKDLVGNAVVTVGRSAGRHMAKKLPIYLDKPTLIETVEAVGGQMRAGFDMTCRGDDTGAELEIGRCAIRDVCQNRAQELGGDVCRMFHTYLGGIVHELWGRPVRSTITAAAAGSCRGRLDPQG